MSARGAGDDSRNLGQADARLDALEASITLQRQSDELLDRRRREDEASTVEFVRRRLAELPLEQCDQHELSEIRATLEDIAHDRVSGTGDGNSVELFDGRFYFTLEQFKAEKHDLLTRLDFRPYAATCPGCWVSVEGF